MPSLLVPPEMMAEAEALLRQTRQALAPTHTEWALAGIAEARRRPVLFERAVPHEQPALLAYTPGR